MKRYTVMGYDTFSREEYHIDSFSSIERAKAVAKEHSGQMTLVYVFDSLTGLSIARYGTY